jgi:hypothetical protein
LQSSDLADPATVLIDHRLTAHTHAARGNITHHVVGNASVKGVRNRRDRLTRLERIALNAHLQIELPLPKNRAIDRCAITQANGKAPGGNLNALSLLGPDRLAAFGFSVQPKGHGKIAAYWLVRHAGEVALVLHVRRNFSLCGAWQGKRSDKKKYARDSVEHAVPLLVLGSRHQGATASSRIS